MGITSLTMGQIERLSSMGYPLAGMRMLELGNQYLYLDPPSDIPHLTPAKGWFEARGVDHTSIDLNGKDGAIALDLSKPLLGWKPFDVVTNFGTAEHVSDYWQCLKNMHDLTRIGGLMFHVSPAKDHWPGHGMHYVNLLTFKILSELCGYDVAFIERHPSMGNFIDGDQIHAMMVRRYDEPFPTREKFSHVVPVFPK